MADEVQDKRSLADELVSRWPSLPFLAFGIWTAWGSLTYSGSLWLSDNEVDGYNLSVLFVASTVAFAAAFLLAPVLFRDKWSKGGPSNRETVASGLLAGLGALIIICIGPYWFGGSSQTLNPLFLIGAALTGVGTAGIAFRCASLYGGLPPRRVLIFAALSQLVGAFVYFMVMASPQWAPIEHGPSLVGILTFCLLPVGAAALACIQPAKESLFDEGSCLYTTDIRMLPGTFWRFAAFAFSLALITTFIRSSSVSVSVLANTVEGNNMLQILRAGMAVVVIIATVRSGSQGFDLGRVCSIASVVAAVTVAFAAAIGSLTGWLSVLVYFASTVFEFVMWCLLSFIVCQRHVSSLTVFGFGRGLFMLGCAVGWALGLMVMPILDQAGLETPVFLVLAGTIIVLWLALFSQKDYERLFSQVGEDALSLEDLFEIDVASEVEVVQEAEKPAAGKRGRFMSAIDAVAREYSLSAREADVLRYLAMGYGSERIAEVMGVKVNTVRTHTHNVYVKLDVHSREELMRLVDDAVADQQA